MKVSLFYPPVKSRSEIKEQINPPIGILYIASNLLEKGHKVTFHDGIIEDLDVEKFKQILLKERPDYVGIGFVSILRNAGFEFARVAKEILPNVKVVIGGVHTSIFPIKVLEKYDFIDYIIYNEGEVTFAELIKKGPRGTKGVCYRKGKKVVMNPPRDPIKDLDALPKVRWDLCNMKKYIKNTKESGADYLVYPNFGIITSRGCPGRCTFCASQKLSINVRRHSPKYVYNLVKELRDKYGIKDIYFLDDTFALDINWLKEYRDLLQKKPLDVVYSGQLRANTSDEVLKLLKQIGFYLVNVGVESGSQKVLNSMRKGIVVNQIHQCIETAKKVGLMVKVYLIFGDVSETKEDIQKTVALVNSLPIDEFVWGRLMFLPGSGVAYNKGIPDDWWFKNNYIPFTENFDPALINYAWFLMSVNSFFRQTKFKSKLNHKPWILAAIERLLIIGGLGIFINKIHFKTKFRYDLLAYLFLPIGIILTATGINKKLLEFFLGIKYGQKQSIYFDKDKDIFRDNLSATA
ncbi:radical SAM protein [Candidatus Woesearchaeota archaeon]|jgi:anaerobic magnesium-protoporphyrin IX monomethyl ester cyclase|nr:radical SAM protein [Candidatus Woesearchaeota archaeon]MBT4114299.1 radical SAM protein [Candidatus Woesearchaeota archaeon]MBT4248443.1 radical SAM protein [Candidatus Woesearchaeota archaeon]